MRPTQPRDGVYAGGFAGSSQLDPADSLIGELGEDPLDPGYSPPDYEPYSAHSPGTSQDVQHETLGQRLSEEEPEVADADLDDLDVQQRAGRLVGAGLAAEDSGYAGWAASAEEAAMHITEPDDTASND